MLHRLLFAALGLLVLWHSIGGYLRWKARFAELTEIAETHGVADRRPDVVPGMRRDAGPTRAAIRLARAILADELDSRWIGELPPDEQAEERRRGLERLDIAYRLGVESLAERPGSWEALLVIGGAEYLRLARGQSQRLLIDQALWREPLEEAHRLAPLQPEPLRFLAAADLGNWSVLSADERQAASERLAVAFTDATTFDLLSTAWLRVAPSLTAALEVVPDETWAWSGLMRYFARRADWERYCDARVKAAAVTREYILERLHEAEDRLRWNDRDKGLQRLIWTGANTRPDVANLELMEGLLALAPPGFGGEASTVWLRQWLDWAIERCTHDGCKLSQPAFVRLIGLNRDLPAPQRAWALTLAGDLRAAEAVERDVLKAQPSALDSLWTPYRIGKARLVAAAGNTVEATEILALVPVSQRNSIDYQQARRLVAEAAGDAQDARAAEAWLAGRRRRAWSVDDWSATRRQARLEIYPQAAAAGIGLRIAAGESGRGALEILWDGSVMRCVPAADGRTLDLELPVSADRHVLELHSLEGAASARAVVRLLAPAS